jgi:hypothetical protein
MVVERNIVLMNVIEAVPGKRRIISISTYNVTNRTSGSNGQKDVPTVIHKISQEEESGDEEDVGMQLHQLG